MVYSFTEYNHYQCDGDVCEKDAANYGDNNDSHYIYEEKDDNDCI